MEYSGTVSRGVKGPIIREGDDLVNIVSESLQSLVNNENVQINDGDILCITESVVGISQGNFATVEQISEEVRNSFDGDIVGVVFPILSRNRFSMLLKGITKGVKRIVVQLSYPSDEVGNKLISMDEFWLKNINPYSDVFTQNEFREIFNTTVHEFTGIDYIKLYQDIIGDKGEIIFSNDPKTILKYTNEVLVANVHDRKRTKDIILKAGGKVVLGLDELLTQSINGSGYNPDYGLLGSNLYKGDSVKLFPRDCKTLVYEIQKKLFQTFGKKLEVMIYGDGAFKDPKGGIWELADPVVSPGYTSGLVGTPQEIKLKHLAANKLNNLENEELEETMKKIIKEKDNNLLGKMASQGTTPRQITDLLGSLADLTSGSGDKGTPFVLIQNYFSNYAS